MWLGVSLYLISSFTTETYHGTHINTWVSGIKNLDIRPQGQRHLFLGKDTRKTMYVHVDK